MCDVYLCRKRDAGGLGVHREVVGGPVGDADAFDPTERHLDLGVPAVARVVGHFVREVLQGEGMW